MRVSKDKAAQNRQEILAAASRLFRERGIGATGVDTITADAGLTHGAVYSQFGSKEAITVEAIRGALSGSAHLWQRLAERKGRDRAFAAIVQAYLSSGHRDHAGRGCVVAALGGELARQPERVRDAFTAELEEALHVMAGLMPGDDGKRSYDHAIAAFASMAGAVILARAVTDKELSDRILKTTANSILDSSRRQVRQATSSKRSAAARRS